MKKATKFLVGSMLTIVMALGMNTTMSLTKAATWEDNFSYQVNEEAGTVILTQYKGNATDVTVPGKVTINGKKYTVTFDHMQNEVWGSKRKTITSVKFEEGFQAPEHSNGLFQDFEKLQTVDVSKVDLSKVVEINYMFSGCKELKEVNANNWDTSNVTEMVGVFDRCSALYKIEVQNWNTSNVETMDTMFYGCRQLTSLDLHKWNTSKVKSLGYMFAGCTHLKSVNLSGWDTKNVEELDGLFESASSLTSVDMSSFDLSKCAISKNDHIFLRCGSLKTIKTPKKLKKSIELDGTLTYKCKGKKYTKVPKGNKSIKLVCVTKAAQAPKISSVKSKKGKVTVTWKKIKLSKIEKLSDQEIHYELQCSTNKRFTDNVGKFSNYSDMDSKKHVPNTIDGIIWKNTSTISGLQKGKTYYIRVRTDRNYALISKWSKVKTIKVK